MEGQIFLFRVGGSRVVRSPGILRKATPCTHDNKHIGPQQRPVTYLAVRSRNPGLGGIIGYHHVPSRALGTRPALRGGHAVYRTSGLLGGRPPGENVDFSASTALFAHFCNPQVPDDPTGVYRRSERQILSGSSQGCLFYHYRSRPPCTDILKYRARVHTRQRIRDWTACALGHRVYSRRPALWACHSGSLLCPEEFLAGDHRSDWAQ